MSTPAEWLRSFEQACRACDFAAGRRHFAADAIAFGTWARAVSGLDNIEREQWRNVWPRIRNFTLESPAIGEQDGLAWIAAPWWSDATAPDGGPLRREGRATFVLARRDGRWQCVHSHVSLLPSQSPTVHGRPAG
jgi:ketosteroid isomerase-like protein